MPKPSSRPNLSVGNHIYLYRLLSESIGCGKQTLVAPKIEDALAADRMTAEDLGFADTRELLEELDDFITLTVFKGGRIYATVNTQPTWDEALSQPDKQPATKAGKSWKRKKTDKSLKPQRPRRVKRDVPVEQDDERRPKPVEEPKPAGETADGAVHAASAPIAEHAVLPDDGVCTADTTAREAAQPDRAESAETRSAKPDERPGATAEAQAEDGGRAASIATPGVTASKEKQESAQTPSRPEEEPHPAITLTVIYDPENANGGMTTLESTPGITSADLRASGKTDRPGGEPDRMGRDMADGAAVSAEHREPELSAEPGGKPAAEQRPDTPEDRKAAVPNQDETAGTVRDEPARNPTVHEATPPTASVARAQEPPHEVAHAPERDDGGNAASPQEQDARPAAPVIPDGYPRNIALDVYCPGDLLREISYLFPYGADVMGILNEYYHIAVLQGTLNAARNRASFPFSHSMDGKRVWSTLRIKRSGTDGGTSWIVDRIDR